MQQDINDLLKRYNAGTATEEDIEFLESWYNQYQAGGPDYHPADQVLDAITVWDGLRPAPVQAKRVSLWPRVASAASVILMLSAGGYFMLRNEKPQLSASALAASGNKAILALPGGRHIALASLHNGALTANISKVNGNELIYRENKSSPKSDVKYDTLIVPRGGHFQLTMADGSKIWLNAATVVRYPETCDGNERQVKLLKGEAYFEVVHDSKKPFRVISRNQVIEDVGTRFNVNAYDDEPNVRTTLLDGSVSVADNKNKVVLRPGQQSQVNRSGSNIIVKNADVDEAVAWKNDRFIFNNDDVTSVMRQVSRWYDMDVYYEGDLTGREFTGSVLRSEKVQEVLRKLEETGTIHYRIEGKKIIVTP